MKLYTGHFLTFLFGALYCISSVSSRRGIGGGGEGRSVSEISFAGIGGGRSKGPKISIPKVSGTLLENKKGGKLKSPFYPGSIYKSPSGVVRGTHKIVSKKEEKRCARPISPNNGHLFCTTTERERKCIAKCKKGFMFPNNATQKRVKCSRLSGRWRPTKDLPDCISQCQCKNGGKCVKSGKCQCPAEYRGPQCQYHYALCDIQRISRGNRISRVCTHSMVGTACSAKCVPPKTFASPPAEKYRCLPNGTWIPDTMPDCVDQQVLSNHLV